MIGMMCFCAIAVGFTMRACLSVAITEMTIPSNSSAKGNESIICPVDALSTGNSHHSKPV